MAASATRRGPGPPSRRGTGIHAQPVVRRHRGGYGILPPARGRPGRGEASAADPAPTEALDPTRVRRQRAGVDLDLVDELAARRRPELTPMAADLARRNHPAAARGSGSTRRGPVAAAVRV